VVKVDPEAEAEVEGMIQMPHLIKVQAQQVLPIEAEAEAVEAILAQGLQALVVAELVVLE
jgi:hypothetical protein